MAHLVQHAITEPAGFVHRRLFSSSSPRESQSHVGRASAVRLRPQTDGDISPFLQGNLPWFRRSCNPLRTVHAGRAAFPANAERGRRQRTHVVYSSLRDGAETPSLSHIETTTFVGGDERGIHSGTNLLVQRESTSAVGAGRSKAKKGGGPGGKIERRPPPPQKVPRKRPGPSGADENDGSKSKQSGKGRGVVGSSQTEAARVGESQRVQEDPDDISWLLGDDYKSSEGERKTKLVGGWGRDKSMQREVPVQSEAKLRGAKGGKTKSSPGPRTPPGKLPPLPIDDPTIRYPDKDYIDGPFGPYAWRGVCIGEPIEGNFTTTQVVFFSNVVDDEDKEDRERYNYTVEYTDKVDTFDEEIGVLYYYVFARSQYGPRQEPWRDWTLAAQLAVESGEELDQRVLFSRLKPNIQDIMLKCVAWVRPDLIYVRKPRLQLRLEAQDKFMTELLHILNQPDTPDSYYGKLCQILRVHPTSSSEDVKAAYDALTEEKKLECLAYLLTQHPVKLLASARYNRKVQGIDDENGEVAEPDFSGVELSMDTSAPAENADDDEDVESVRDFSHEQQQASAGGTRAQDETKSGEETQELGERLQLQRYSHKRSRYEPEPGPAVRSAVRPFNYSHFVEEIATIHNILHGSDSSTEWIREAVNSR